MTFPLARTTNQFAAVRANDSHTTARERGHALYQLAVAACRQVECQANCVKIFRLAGLRLNRLLGFVGNGLCLRRLSLRILMFRRPNRRRDRFAPLSIGDTRFYGCHRCSRQRLQPRQRFGFRRGFGRRVIRLCQFGFGGGSNIGERRQPICFRESLLNRICDLRAIGL